MEKKTPDYGNWVPAAMMRTLELGVLALAVLEFVLLRFVKINWLSIVGAIALAIMACFAIYMYCCRRAFDFEHGGVMAKVHEYLVQHLDWDGKGRLLDIGCGAGALTIRCAKKFKSAQLVGMDYWGAGWSYAQKQCESNAEIEGVADRVTFQKGDAAKLDFKDGEFDAVVSNFVFHEVQTAPDKRDVIREALRVLCKGGAFALQDMFEQKALYGDMNDMVVELRKAGFAEVHYIPNIEQKCGVPGFIQTPWMVKGAGLLYGRK